MTQFEATKQEVKTIIEATTHFWKSVIQDEQLDRLTKQAQEAEAQLMMLNTLLREISIMVQIKHSKELKDLQ